MSGTGAESFPSSLKLRRDVLSPQVPWALLFFPALQGFRGFLLRACGEFCMSEFVCRTTSIDYSRQLRSLQACRSLLRLCQVQENFDWSERD